MKYVLSIQLIVIAVCIYIIAVTISAERAFIQQCKDTGGVPITSSKANVCLSVNAVIRLER